MVQRRAPSTVRIQKVPSISSELAEPTSRRRERQMAISRQCPGWNRLESFSRPTTTTRTMTARMMTTAKRRRDKTRDEGARRGAHECQVERHKAGNTPSLSLSLSLCLLFFSFFRQCQGTVGRKEKEKCARENAPKRLRSRLCKFMQEPPSPSPPPPKNERKTRRQLRDPRSTQLRGTKRDEMDGESR